MSRGDCDSSLVAEVSVLPILSAMKEFIVARRLSRS